MRRCIYFFVLPLLGVSALTLPAARGEVIISEIMYNPQGTDLDTSVTPNIMREWAELYNTGDTAVNIGGLQVGEAGGNQKAPAFSADTVIHPPQGLAVYRDTNPFSLSLGT